MSDAMFGDDHREELQRKMRQTGEMLKTTKLEELEPIDRLMIELKAAKEEMNEAARSLSSAENTLERAKERSAKARTRLEKAETDVVDHIHQGRQGR